jgi:osmotically-inducible protein OsmY
MEGTAMNNDRELQRRVMSELACEPGLNPAHIGVAVVGGIVVLAGHLQSYEARHLAETAARRSGGVKAIAQEIEVPIGSMQNAGDLEIARRIVDRLTSNPLIPTDKIDVKVQNGFVTLSGSVECHLQASEAERAAQIPGITGMSDLIIHQAGSLLIDRTPQTAELGPAADCQVPG